MRRLAYLLMGSSVGLMVGLLAFGSAFPSPDPSIWRIYAESVGVWPSTGPLPVFWRGLVSLGCTPTAVSALSAGLLAFAFFDICWRMVLLLVGPQDGHPNWPRLTVPSVSLLGAGLAAFSEPVWRQALSGSPELVTLALLLLSVDLVLASFFQETTLDDEGEPVGSFRARLCVGSAFVLSGALLAETPLAVILPFVFSVVRERVSLFAADGRYRGDEEPRIFAPLCFPKWIAFLLWSVGCVSVFIVASQGAGGLLRHLVDQVRGIRNAATPLGWLLWPGCRIVPIVIVAGLVPTLTAKVSRKTFVLGVVTLLVGIASLVFVSPAVRGDWPLDSSAVVRSPFMQMLGAVLSAQAAALVLAAFAWLVCHDMPRDDAVRPVAVWCVAVALLATAAVAVGGIDRTPERRLRQAVADAVDETVREAEGLTAIFTDGSADVGLELAARRLGRNLRTMPLIRGGPLASTNESVSVLRDWFSSDSTNLQFSAFQLGFDLWRRERRVIPPVSGLLARTDWPEAGRERGIAFAEELADRMAGFSRDGLLGRESEPRVRDLFLSVLWRLSRLARQRGDMDRADRLDAANASWHQTQALIHRERTAVFRQTTDREGLQLALNRANFAGARYFARRILERTPDDSAANFALGMACLMESSDEMAVFYLEKARRAKPNEPAILNNLAIAYLRTGDLVQAEVWAKKAFERAPEIPEVRETVRRIASERASRAP